MDNSKETYNYFKLVQIVVNLITEVMREVFKNEWDMRYPGVPWQDNLASKHEFRKRQPPHGIADKIGQRNFKNLMNTSGDRNEWDITLLCYTLLSSKPINLKTTSTVGGVIDTLRTIRNDVMHIKEAKLSDADFKKKYTQIKGELSKLLPLCQPYYNKLKNVKRDRLAPDIIADLKVQIAKEKRTQQHEKIQKVIVIICSLLIIAFMAWIIYLLCVNFIPDSLPAYFPDQHVPLYFHSRTNEIEKVVKAIISGVRVTVLCGSTGIGKKSTSLVIGRYIKALWRPFPWFCVCYVPLYGVRDVRGMELQVMKSFYAENDVTLDNIDYKFMDLMAHRIKRKTLIILDGGPQLFVTDKRNVWKDLIGDILDINRNIHIIITTLQPVSFVKHAFKTIFIKSFTSKESIFLMDRIAPEVSNEIKNTLNTYLSGSPVFIEMFMHLIKVDQNAEDVIRYLKLKAEPENLCEVLIVFLEILSPFEEMLVRFISLFPSKVSLPALKSCNFYTEQVLTLLISKSVIKESVESDERQFTLHPIFKMLPLCERVKQHPIELEIKLSYCFNKHYITEAKRIAEDFLSASSMNIDTLKIFDLEGNLKIMLENGPSIDEYWKPQKGNKVLLPGEQIYQKDFYNTLFSATLPKKYDGTHVYSLKRLYYNMLFYVSPLLTYGVSSTIFSKHVYIKAASALQIEYDFDSFIKMIYSQCDKGDIFFFQQTFENDDSINLIQQHIRHLRREEHCDLLIEKSVKAICVLFVGRVLALYSQMKIVSTNVRSCKDIKKGTELIDRSIEVFTSLDMNLTVAEAHSTKGLLQYVARNKYGIGKMHYLKALSIVQNVYNKHPILAASYFNVGFMCYQMGEFNLLLAIKYFNMSFDIYNKTLGIHRRTAHSAFYLGKSLQEVGKYIESIPILAKAHALHEEVMLKDKDISETARDSEKLKQMKKLHDNAWKEADFDANYFYPLEDWHHLRAAFQAMTIGNAHRGLDNFDLAKHYFNLSRNKLISLSNDNSNLNFFVDLLKEDIDEFLVVSDHLVVEQWVGQRELTFFYRFIGAVVLLLLTLVFIYIYIDKCMFSYLESGFIDGI